MLGEEGPSLEHADEGDTGPDQVSPPRKVPGKQRPRGVIQPRIELEGEIRGEALDGMAPRPEQPPVESAHGQQDQTGRDSVREAPRTGGRAHATPRGRESAWRAAMKPPRGEPRPHRIRRRARPPRRPSTAPRRCDTAFRQPTRPRPKTLTCTAAPSVASDALTRQRLALRATHNVTGAPRAV